MKTTKLIMAAVLALGLAACTENEPEITVNCCCGGTSVTETKLVGVFSVAKNHKVRFAPGNLQYKAGNWRFADEQFQYMGYQNDKTDANWNNYVHDLFAFGQTGYSLAGMISLTSKDPSDYGGYNKSSNTYESIVGTNWDWGIFCAIENGGNQPGMWRTLSKDEWNYLLKQRTNATKLYAPAMVDGRRGVMILADNYNHPEGVARLNPEKSFTDGENTYCYKDWKKMEAGGAVFLPCCGSKDPTQSDNDKQATYYPEMSGYYWTTTQIVGTGTDSEKYKNAYAMRFGYERTTGTQTPTYYAIGYSSTPKYYRCAVRLVQETK